MTSTPAEQGTLGKAMKEREESVLGWETQTTEVSLWGSEGLSMERLCQWRHLGDTVIDS